MDMCAKKISDSTMENVEILSKLALSSGEREKAKEEMGKILSYIEKLNELDTENVEPLVHIFEEDSCFREDAVTNGDGRADALKNAPKSKGGQYVVPKTV